MLVIFDYFHPAGGIILSFFYIFITWWLFSPPSILREEKVAEEEIFLLAKPASNVIGFAIAFVLIFLVCFLPLFFLEDVCYCESPSDFSTKYTRSSICSSADATPCFIYLLVPENGLNRMNIHFHFAKETHGDAWLYYDLLSVPNHAPVSQYRMSQKAKVIQQSHEEGDRWVHWVELNQLLPDTTYYFRAGFGSENQNYSPERKFRTLPNRDTFVFASGGDMGVTTAAEKLMQVIGRRSDISFIFIGGDLSYAPTGASACRLRWDKWLRLINNYAIDAKGFTLPLVLAIGNHDAVDKSSPFFLTWFAFQQNYSSSLKPIDRPTYHSHIVSSNTLIISLDSGHVTRIEDQVDWLNQQYATPFTNKIPAYHVPIYPSWRDPDGPRQQLMKRHWRPIFQKSLSKLVLEHHDHMYKRSKRLTDDLLDSNGTLYLGDGCMGTDPRIGAPTGRYYIDFTKETQHFYFISVNKTRFDVEAIDQDANTIDRFSLP